MAAAYVRRRRPRLLLFQNANHLLFAEPRSLHRLSPRRDELYPFLEEIESLRSGDRLGIQVKDHVTAALSGTTSNSLALPDAHRSL
jgi:hypothetical protein